MFGAKRSLVLGLVLLASACGGGRTSSPADGGSFPFSIQPPGGGAVTLAPGQTLAFPLHLRRQDVFFQFGGASPDPAYVGETLLGCSGALPTGLVASFPDANRSDQTADPTGLASAPFQITAAPGLAPGTYQVELQATRVSGATTPAAPLTLTVNITRPAAAPTVWFQGVEWGQTVLAPDLRLVGGKSALLRAQLLADRAGVPAPAVTAVVADPAGAVLDTLTLQGPDTVPTVLAEGDLPTGWAASASSWTAILPPADVRPGMRVTLQAAALSLTLTPSVDPGRSLDLTLVPVIHKGVAPELPADLDMTNGLLAFWPIRAVNLTHRAAYTTAIVLPQPSDPGYSAGWAQLLGELTALRIADGSGAGCYGMLDPGIDSAFGSAQVGISVLGQGVGLGIDSRSGHRFANSDPFMDLAVRVLIHEQGHAFNLDHAPAGGAGNPQLTYPYAGAAIGAWGYDPSTQTAHDPAREFDIMSYAEQPHWVSDWNYRNAMAFLDQREQPQGAAAQDQAGSDQWVVSGWTGPDGQVHLAPLLRARCAPMPPRAGGLSLVLRSGETAATVPFGVTPVPDLPPGHGQFCFTVPAAGEVSSAEVRAAGARALRLPSRSLAVRTGALAAAVRSGTLVAREARSLLHLEWDAGVHPYVNVLHEGVRRTTLALHLTGGSADVSLAGLPPGGSFVIHYSDGLNPVERTLPRSVGPEDQ